MVKRTVHAAQSCLSASDLASNSIAVGLITGRLRKHLARYTCLVRCRKTGVVSVWRITSLGYNTVIALLPGAKQDHTVN